MRAEAGFPSPADDSIDRALDLHEHLVRNQAATFFVRVHGHSMSGAGIRDGDLLVVDRAREPRDGCVVLAAIDGELCIKRLARRGEQACLVPEHEDYPAIELDADTDLLVWGVATFVIHAL